MHFKQGHSVESIAEALGFEAAAVIAVIASCGEAKMSSVESDVRRQFEEALPEVFEGIIGLARGAESEGVRAEMLKYAAEVGLQQKPPKHAAPSVSVVSFNEMIQKAAAVYNKTIDVIDVTPKLAIK